MVSKHQVGEQPRPLPATLEETRSPRSGQPALGRGPGSPDLALALLMALGKPWPSGSFSIKGSLSESLSNPRVHWPSLMTWPGYVLSHTGLSFMSIWLLFLQGNFPFSENYSPPGPSLAQPPTDQPMALCPRNPSFHPERRSHHTVPPTPTL